MHKTIFPFVSLEYRLTWIYCWKKGCLSVQAALWSQWFEKFGIDVCFAVPTTHSIPIGMCIFNPIEPCMQPTSRISCKFDNQRNIRRICRSILGWWNKWFWRISGDRWKVCCAYLKGGRSHSDMSHCCYGLQRDSDWLVDFILIGDQRFRGGNQRCSAELHSAIPGRYGYNVSFYYLQWEGLHSAQDSIWLSVMIHYMSLAFWESNYDGGISRLLRSE